MTQTPSASPAHAVNRSADEPFPSPLFRDVAARFNRTERRVILELGATSAGTLDLLEGKRCRLLVADAAPALCELSERPVKSDPLRQRLETLLFDAGEEKIDTVLCWDLLNYLSPPLLTALAARLSAIMAPEGVVHAYIHSAQTAMPSRPQRYSPLGADLVVRLGRDAADRTPPRYSAWDLEKHGIGLRVERSMLLRNGMQEYLMGMDPTRSGPRDVKALYETRPLKA